MRVKEKKDVGICIFKIVCFILGTTHKNNNREKLMAAKYRKVLFAGRKHRTLSHKKFLIVI